ncbi:hypothetical protein EJ05DRAFT_153689 [Pseudovirgaria hyperparasitica]|uniref:N-acetyltransferase domain-containing protein n=1 Tax=Pseudovirgaria hyperparasitica TaxID=470096 RepID=A0A6A6VVJ6_9PEZI|nr:uncharacterized protein EJ05DRAFT_153689 [Pseudovirgaria hyperparasitica]KAF2754253.1 hypothetical protein EJ05DRAFT_153689 [Pseudovirgaria hyperparasitica]
MPPHSKTYIHPSSGATLVPHLRQFLPHSLPLYRRLNHSFKTEDALILSTFPPPDPNAASHATPAELPRPHLLPQCFAAAFVDRSHRPATEMWLFLSGEVDGRCACARELGVRPTGDIVSEGQEDAQLGHTHVSDLDRAALESREPLLTPCASALLSLMKFVGTNVEWRPHTAERLEDVERAARLVDAMKKAADEQHPEAMKSHYPEHAFFLRDVHNPGVMKLGAVAALPSTILHLYGLLVMPPIRDLAHHMYVFRVPDGLPHGRELGRGLRWGKVREQDLDLVRIRSPIPKTHRTLKIWNSMSVYSTTDGTKESGQEHSSEAVAWAFLGYDGSLSSMHVEPEYRGKGIAKTLAAKLFREYPEEDGWALAYVGVGNRESEAVCEGIGGVSKAWVWWLRVNMDTVKTIDT